MKTAYLINCHKNMKHVSRLVHRLHSEDSHIFIHVDKKVSEDDFNSLFSYTSDLKYCYISKTRIDGKLDDRSLVDIVMVLISDAKKKCRTEFDSLFIFCEYEWPRLSNQTIEIH